MTIDHDQPSPPSPRPRMTTILHFDSSISRDSAWSELFRRLEQYRDDFGDTDVPQNYFDDPELAQWVQSQRALYQQGKLSLEKQDALQKTEFCFQSKSKSREQEYELAWIEKFDAYKAYIEAHGPGRPSDSKLVAWTARQRKIYKEGKLEAERIQQLDAIGFDWTPPKGNHVRPGSARTRPYSWEEMYQLLVKYKQEHGNCEVPQQYAKAKYLGRWVNRQRDVYAKGEIKPDRMARLEAIGFTWKLPSRGLQRRDDLWLEHFTKLKAFRKQHGHLRIPRSHKELGEWCHRQRRAYREKNIDTHRKTLLEAFGFDWMWGANGDKAENGRARSGVETMED